MSFAFFTLNSLFFWEDVYNYDNWVIQLNVRTLKYRLLDPFAVRREAGSFEQCKETLLKYIAACELKEPKKDTILILHGFGKNKASVKGLADGLKDMNANIIVAGMTTLRRGATFHANILDQMLQNTDIKGRLYIIDTGASCLIVRRLLSSSRNYRRYNIERILDINPMNSGSETAGMLAEHEFFNFLLGPMLQEISTPYALKFDKLPEDIDHGIIFAPSLFAQLIKKLTARYESFPFSTPPAERSYADKVCNVKIHSLQLFKDPALLEKCKNFITTGDFSKSRQ